LPVLGGAGPLDWQTPALRISTRRDGFPKEYARTKKEENGMPVITGFDKLASVPEEQITDKIGRRVISGKQGTMVYWRMKAGGDTRWGRARSLLY
jgi:hypothetical protein